MADRKSAPGGSNIDPTRMIDQPALRTSTGLVWLVVGGILAAIGFALLLAMTTINPVIAWPGAIAIVVLYAAMVVIRFAIAPLRARLFTLATLFCAITIVALVCVFIIASQQGGALR